MTARRNVRVTLTEREWLALHQTVVGELESLTDADRESGVYDDLFDASEALERGWSRRRRDSRSVE